MWSSSLFVKHSAQLSGCSKRMRQVCMLGATKLMCAQAAALSTGALGRLMRHGCIKGQRLRTPTPDCATSHSLQLYHRTSFRYGWLGV